MWIESLVNLIAVTAQLIIVIVIGTLMLISFAVYLLSLLVAEIVKYTFAKLSNLVFGYFPKLERLATKALPIFFRREELKEPKLKY